jgi:hypothetical protein
VRGGVGTWLSDLQIDVSSSSGNERLRECSGDETSIGSAMVCDERQFGDVM